MPAVRTFLILLLLALMATAVRAAEPVCEKTRVFPREGNSVCRIPSLVVSKNGVLLAFGDQRKGSNADWGHDTDMVLRRSSDGGKSWLPMQTVATRAGSNYHGGPALVDAQTGRIFKFFKSRPASFKDPKRFQSEFADQTAKWKEWGVGSYVVHSDDDGATWSPPRRLELEHPDAVGTLDVGNGIHGLQLSGGTLVIQGYCAAAREVRAEDENSARSFLLLSRDHGETWTRGAEWPTGYAAMEYALVDTNDGGIYVNQRSQGPHRKVLWLADAEKKSAAPQTDASLPEPVCHAGLARLSSAAKDGRSRILFVNPGIANAKKGFNAETRRQLTVRLSYDEGKTWPVARVLEVGRAGYADLAVGADGTIFCIYEEGKARYDEHLTVARFNLEWLSEGKDQLAPKP